MPYQPRATFDNPYGPQVTFRTEDVLPPTAYYMGASDYVRVVAITNVAPVTITLEIRFLTPQGEIKQMPYTQILNTNGGLAVVLTSTPIEGYILGAIAFAQSPGIGQCFAYIDIVRGTGAAIQGTGQILMQGYIAALSQLNYPPTTLNPQFGGPGTVNTITAPNPGASFPFRFVVPANTRWNVRSIQAGMNTDAAAGNRVALLIISDPNSNQLAQIPAGAVVAASTSTQCTWAPSFSPQLVSTYALGGLPAPLVLPAGYGVAGYIAGADPGDFWTGPTLSKEEWVGI